MTRITKYSIIVNNDAIGKTTTDMVRGQSSTKFQWMKGSERTKIERGEKKIELFWQYLPFCNLLPLEICSQMTLLCYFHNANTRTDQQNKKKIHTTTVYRQKQQVSDSLSDHRISMSYLYKIIWPLFAFFFPSSARFESWSSFK